MPISQNMRRLIDFAQSNLDNVSVGVTAGLMAPEKGIGIEFTIQKRNQRWGFRLREEKGSDYKLLYVTELRPGLFRFGLRGYFNPHHFGEKISSKPLTLSEIIEEWPSNFWPKGLELLKRLADVSKK